MSTIEEARALLAKATPGEWTHVGIGDVSARIAGVMRQVACVSGSAPMHGDVGRAAHEIRDANADLIAAAPRIIAALIAELEAAEKRAEAAEVEVGRLTAYIAQEDTEADAAIARAESAERQRDEWKRAAMMHTAGKVQAWTERDTAIIRARSAERTITAVTTALGDWMDGSDGDVKRQYTPEGAVLAVLAHVDRLTRERDEARAERDTARAQLVVSKTMHEDVERQWSEVTDAISEHLTHGDGDDRPDIDVIIHAAKRIARVERERDEARAERDAARADARSFMEQLHDLQSRVTSSTDYERGHDDGFARGIEKREAWIERATAAEAERDARMQITAEDAAKLANWIDVEAMEAIDAPTVTPDWVSRTASALRAHAGKVGR